MNKNDDNRFENFWEELTTGLRKHWKAFVFVVDKFSFPVHRSRGFCGVKNPRRRSSLHSLFADIKATREGDLVFFYQRRVDEPPEERGFRGIYKIISDPFYDDTNVNWNTYEVLGKCPICDCIYSEKNSKCICCNNDLNNRHILPNRLLIDCIAHFNEPVDDNTAYVDRTDHGELWTLLFRKVWGPGRARSAAPILPEEAKKIARLLFKINNGVVTQVPSFVRYPRSIRRPININSILCEYSGKEAPTEAILQAWFMENIDRRVSIIRDIIGDIEDLEWFGNEIIYGIGGDKVDILCTHKSEDIRYKATVIELKKGKISRSSVMQIRRYSYWISQLVTANVEPPTKKLVLQPVLIGKRIDNRALSTINRMGVSSFVIPYKHRDPCTITIVPPIVLEYNIRSCGNLDLEMIQRSTSINNIE